MSMHALISSVTYMYDLTTSLDSRRVGMRRLFFQESLDENLTCALQLLTEDLLCGENSDK